MIPIATLREQTAQYKERLQKRGISAAEIDAIILADNNRKNSQQKFDALQSQLKLSARAIGQLMQQKEIAKAELAKAETTQLKDKIKEAETQNKQAELHLQTLLYNLPNAPHTSVKAGFSDQDNEVVQQPNKMPDTDGNTMPHWEIAEKMDWIDFSAGTKITGAGFPVYKAFGAKLQRMLIQFFLEENIAAGYQEILPPLLVNADSAMGTGQLPDKEGQMYSLSGDNFYLIPTAEVPVTNILRNTILSESDLPKKYTAYTPCFRREAGSYGKDVRGLNRLHQFDKVEIVQAVKPENSYQVLDEMVNHVEQLLKKLDLPYRLLRLCSGDLGFAATLTYDFEVYSKAQKKWLEVSSISNFEDFQSNRMKIRYKSGNNKPQLVHTLNGSALALPRILAALLENNFDGEKVCLPAAIQHLFEQKQ